MKRKDVTQLLLFLICLFLTLRFSGSTAGILRPFGGYLICSTLFALFNLKELGKVNTTVSILFVFILYIIISILWSNSPEYGLDKGVMLFLFTFFFIVGQKYIVSNFQKVALYFFICNIIFLLLFYITFGNPLQTMTAGGINGGRLKDDETNPITFSRYLGFVSFFVMFLITTYKNWMWKAILILTMIFSLIYMFFSGSKGPIFAFILTSLTLVYLQNKSIKLKLTYILIFILGIIVLLFQLQNSFVGNFLAYRYTQNEGSYDSREGLISAALEVIGKDGLFYLIFGSGSGNFSFLLYGKDQRWYPHNMIIEVFYEYGLIGIGIILLFIYHSLKGFKYCYNDKVYIYLIALFVYTGFNAMVSGDIYGNFLFFGIGILLQARRRLNPSYSHI